MTVTLTDVFEDCKLSGVILAHSAQSHSSRLLSFFRLL